MSHWSVFFCASVCALIFSIKWFEIFWFEYLLLMRDYHYHGFSIHLFICIHKRCKFTYARENYLIKIFLIKAICNIFPFKFIANVVVHAILHCFICAKANSDKQCAGLSGAVCLCARVCVCVCVCVRARACVCVCDSGSRCPRSLPLFWWSDSCEKPPLVAPSALAVSSFLSHCRLNVTSALELEFYPIVRRQPSPQRHRELPEKQDSAIFIEAEKGEKKLHSFGKEVASPCPWSPVRKAE